MTYSNCISFETRLSERKKPLGSENSVTRVQKARSSSCCGSASIGERDVGVAHSSSEQTASVRIPSLSGVTRSMSAPVYGRLGVRSAPGTRPGRTSELQRQRTAGEFRRLLRRRARDADLEV